MLVGDHLAGKTCILRRLMVLKLLIFFSFDSYKQNNLRKEHGKNLFQPLQLIVKIIF